ncbi:MAG: helix-turn-helix domain-containing protein, partial [Planctomycetaceae bacterium]
MDGIAPTTLEQLVAYPWPGNIRELENVIERAVILCRGSTLEIDPRILQGSLPSRGTTLGTALPVADGPAGAGADTLEAIERNHILAVLDKTNWRIEGDRGAADVLGLHPNTLRSRMKKLGITRPE